MGARGELFRSLGALTEAPTVNGELLAETLGLPGRVADDVVTDLFAFQLYPYASVYLGEQGMLGGEARDRVAGFWRALGLLPPAEPDHLAALLALYASLLEAEGAEGDGARRAMLNRSRKALLWEHLLSWLPAYLEKMKEIAPPPYEAWADLLGRALREEAVELGLPESVPLHLRMAGAPTFPENGKAFIAWALSPIQSGMIIVRSDLQRAASELNLGLRVGERRWVLESFLGQDPQATLSWLADCCRRWSGLHRRWLPVTGDLGRFWLERSARAEGLVLQALAETGEVLAQPAVGV